ncbi:flagellar biosynthesis protein FliQ [Cysteiniphilum sp. QT6929]|uniref:flagellar biosynthesis protein FliQ n=1 Tax=Cysteiniphilum sp. QT6929 TaxID=2975055 RepID=UPI0024B353D3|nr:flagellar biosynthesis protein FliQ [Cysteiniphilum sp. QT6929]WHN66084.1 flagellar biosynthesis protein FliQ [Cysteiniphilum sp. QT6929]
MQQSLAIFFSKALLIKAMIIGAPVIIVALIVGIVISILQAITQIQDSSLSFIPKIIAVALVLMLCGGWMLSELSEYAINLINHIPDYI